MKIIQSFWSGNRSLLNESFGWYSPMYHLMGWTLSALNLAKFYPDTELYTDQHGYDILISKLGLPYRNVHIVLDELNKYPSNLWALGKVKAYAFQKEPFLHVDGDVFIYKKFEDTIHTAGLVAQNLEKATSYYTTRFSEIKRLLPHATEVIDFNLCDQPACSCNAGIMGGSATGFFKNFATKIFNFIDQSQLEQLPAYALVNLNILFEQILFYQMAHSEDRKITCLFETIYDDDGYKYEDFADFTSAPFVRGYLHLIGPNKRNQIACDLMSRVLLKDYPDYYFRIITLLELEKSGYTLQKAPATKADIERTETGLAISVNRKSLETQQLSGAFINVVKEKLQTTLALNPPLTKIAESCESLVLSGAEAYVNAIIDVQNTFQGLSPDHVLAMDISSVTDCEIQFLPREYQLQTWLKQQSPVKVIDTVFNWTLFKEGSDFKSMLNINEESLVRVACTPKYLFPHYEETPFEELDYYIFYLLEAPNTLAFLLKELESCFDPADIQNNYESFFQLILMKVKNLIINKCLCIFNEDTV